MTPSNKAEGSTEIKVSVDPEVGRGVYSNMARVTFTENEFVIGFILNIDDEAHLVSRVIVSPEHMKDLSKAIQQSLVDYNDKFENQSID